MKLQKLRCPNCDGKINIEITDQSHVFCPYCGETFFVDDGKKTVTVNKNININKNVNINKTVTERTINEAEILKARVHQEESRRDAKILIGILCMFIVIALVSFLGYMISEKVAEKKTNEALDAGKISAGFYNDYVDEDYEAVVTQLETLGFKNITTVDLDDSGLAIWNNEKVESVSVNGNTSFSSSDYFYPDDTVIVTYH